MDVINELQAIRIALNSRFDSVQIRGDGRGRYVFAQHQGRAIEVSENNGSWWMEFWKADDNEAASPVAEMTLETTDEAIAHATQWLIQ